VVVKVSSDLQLRVFSLFVISLIDDLERCAFCLHACSANSISVIGHPPLHSNSANLRLRVLTLIPIRSAATEGEYIMALMIVAVGTRIFFLLFWNDVFLDLIPPLQVDGA
jgi:hypothetical protein